MTGIAVGVVFGVGIHLYLWLFLQSFCGSLLNKIGSMNMASTDTIISVFSSCSVAIGLAILSKGGNFSKYSSILVGDVLSITKKEILYLVIIFAVTIIFWLVGFNKLNAICIHRTVAKSKRIHVRLMDKSVCSACGAYSNALHKVDRNTYNKCIAYPSGKIIAQYFFKYAGVSSVFGTVFSIFPE